VPHLTVHHRVRPLQLRPVELLSLKPVFEGLHDRLAQAAESGV
jgi:hypothetical protein